MGSAPSSPFLSRSSSPISDQHPKFTPDSDCQSRTSTEDPNTGPEVSFSTSSKSSLSRSSIRGQHPTITPDSDCQSRTFAKSLNKGPRPRVSLSTSSHSSLRPSSIQVSNTVPRYFSTSSRASIYRSPTPGSSTHSRLASTTFDTPLSPMSLIRQGIEKDNARRNNPSRAQRRPPIVESPESEPSGCHCRLGHRDFEACSADPLSPYYSPGLNSKSPDPMAKTKQTARKPTVEDRGNKKRKAESYLSEEVRYTCECRGGHDTELECEYASLLKKHVEIATSVIIGSQEVVTVNVGTDPKQSFHVHKELLSLFSGYFQDLFAGRIKERVQTKPNQEVKTEPKTNIKQEETSKNYAPLMRENRFIRNLPVRVPLASLPLESPSPESIDLMEPGPSQYHSMSQICSPSAQPISRSANNYSINNRLMDRPSMYNRPINNHAVGASLHRPSHPAPSTEPKTYTLPAINPSQFAQFVSFIYSGRIVDAFEPLIMTIEHNSVEALWYVGQTLRSPSFQNNILEGLRTSQPVKTGAWPSVEDIGVVYDLDVKEDNGDVGEGENKLKKFGAHCLGANNPLVRYESQSAEGQAWSDLLLGKRSEIGKDVLMVAGCQWALTKPWDDSLRGDYMVDEETIEEKWERIILAKRGRGGVKEAAKAGDVGAKLEEGHLEAEKQKLGYERWGYDSEIEDN